MGWLRNGHFLESTADALSAFSDSSHAKRAGQRQTIWSVISCKILIPQTQISQIPHRYQNYENGVEEGWQTEAQSWHEMLTDLFFPDFKLCLMSTEHWARSRIHTTQDHIVIHMSMSTDVDIVTYIGSECDSHCQATIASPNSKASNRKLKAKVVTQATWVEPGQTDGQNWEVLQKYFAACKYRTPEVWLKLGRHARGGVISVLYIWTVATSGLKSLDKRKNCHWKNSGHKWKSQRVILFRYWDHLYVYTVQGITMMITKVRIATSEQWCR